MSTDDTADHTTGDSTERDDATTGDEPSLRQKLHWATGDRDAEAKAVADRAPEDVSEDDAKVAVNRAHGDSPDATSTDSGLATAEDAEEVASERRS